MFGPLGEVWGLLSVVAELRGGRRLETAHLFRDVNECVHGGGRKRCAALCTSRAFTVMRPTRQPAMASLVTQPQ